MMPAFDLWPPQVDGDPMKRVAVFLLNAVAGSVSIAGSYYFALMCHQAPDRSVIELWFGGMCFFSLFVGATVLFVGAMNLMDRL